MRLFNFIIASCICFSAYSQADKVIVKSKELPEKWRLEDCIQYAIDNNVQLLSNKAQTSQAKWSTIAAKTALLPTANANIGVQSDLGRVLDPTSYRYVETDNFTYQGNGSFQADFTVFQGFRKLNQIRKAQADESAARFGYLQAADDIRLQVANAFLTIALRQEALKQRQKQAASSEEQLVQIQQSYDVGAATEGQLLEAKANFSNQEYELINAQNQLELGKLDLQLLLQLNSDNIEIELPTNLDEVMNANMPSLDEVITAALQSRPGIIASEKQVASANYEVKIAQSQFFPSIAFRYTYQTRFSTNARDQFIQEAGVGVDPQTGKLVTIRVPQDGDKISVEEQLNINKTQNLSVGVNIPLFQAGQIYANIQQAKLNKQIRSLQLLDTRNQIRNQVRQSYAAAVGAKQQYEAAKSNMDLATKQFEFAKTRNAVGAISNLEYINAQNNYIIANSTLLTSKYTYILNRVALDLYLGNSMEF